VLLALGLLVGACLPSPLRPVLLAAAGLAAIYLVAWLILAERLLDRRIAATVGASRTWPVHVKVFPSYKMVDLHRGAHALAAEHPGAVTLPCDSTMALSMLLRGLLGWSDRLVQPPTMVARKVAYDEEMFFPADIFFLLPPAPGHDAAVVRVRYASTHHTIFLEIAARQRGTAERLMEDVLRLATASSIYRGRIVRMVFAGQVSDDYGDEDRSEPIDLVFVQDTPVTDDSIVLEESMRETLDRAVVDFHRRRAELMALGLPGRRGLLFYGPPGTGKTFTCKYLAHRLGSATTLIATGYALLHLRAVCAIARALQPALVLLEDVDLVFSDRQINPHGTVLGEFLDQLDGFAPEDEVIFILTTNALERVEAAIKDRPGRISQVIFFGPPGPSLRRRYLERLLLTYDAAEAHLERVVAQTEGVSQAFLKELVFRAVQIASAGTSNGAARLHLTDAHLEAALADLTSGGRAARRLIGFQAE
jgi:hypothetical protein